MNKYMSLELDLSGIRGGYDRLLKGGVSEKCFSTRRLVSILTLSSTVPPLSSPVATAAEEF